MKLEILKGAYYSEGRMKINPLLYQKVSSSFSLSMEIKF